MADHVEDYRLDLLARGDTAKHCRHVAGTLIRLMESAGINSVAEITRDRVQAAVGRLRTKGRSARTCNHALGAVKAFANWLADTKRISEVPGGLRKVQALDEKSDRRHVRRALTRAEIERLLAAAEQGGPLLVAFGPSKSRHHAITLTGPERAALYRLALGTGFRANELRSLTPESFRLDGPEPSVRLKAIDEKNKKGTDQPILPELAEFLARFLEGREPGKPVIFVPEKTAKMLRHDLEAAGIPYQTADGIADFHAIRASYITHLIESGANPRVVQVLARHSTVTLTLERYVKHTNEGLRDALKGGNKI